MDDEKKLEDVFKSHRFACLIAWGYQINVEDIWPFVPLCCQRGRNHCYLSHDPTVATTTLNTSVDSSSIVIFPLSF